MATHQFYAHSTPAFGPFVADGPGPVDAAAESRSDSRPPQIPMPVTSGFAPGTMIATMRGEIPVDRLHPGDRILTRDNGYRPLLGSGHITVPTDPPGATPVAVRFAPASLGPDLPSRLLTVAGCHRILLGGADIALHFGEGEVLAAAGHFPAHRRINRRAAAAGRRFFHILLPDHEIILANGVWSESLFAGEATHAAHHDHFQHLVGDRHRQTARKCLTDWETELALRGGGATLPAFAAA